MDGLDPAEGFCCLATDLTALVDAIERLRVRAAGDDTILGPVVDAYVAAITLKENIGTLAYILIGPHMNITLMEAQRAEQNRLGWKDDETPFQV